MLNLTPPTLPLSSLSSLFLSSGMENLGIVFEFSPWVLKICPEDGLKVRLLQFQIAPLSLNKPPALDEVTVVVKWFLIPQNREPLGDQTKESTNASTSKHPPTEIIKQENEHSVYILCVSLSQIFTEDLTEVESLPRDKVLNFLKEGFKELAVPYLEHIIHVWEETEPEFHNVLIQMYLERVQGLMKQYLNSLPEGKTSQGMTIYTTGGLLSASRYQPAYFIGQRKLTTFLWGPKGISSII